MLGERDSGRKSNFQSQREIMKLSVTIVTVIVVILFKSTVNEGKLNVHTESILASWRTPLFKNVTALILARGGSKGIRLKNLARVGNETLLGRSLRIIQQSDLFGPQVWVSTDDPQIADEAIKYRAKVFVRSERFAGDNATAIESVLEFLERHPEVKHLALIQCTSPFLNSDYLRSARLLFESTDCVFSAQPSTKLIWRKTGDGRVIPFNFDVHSRPRRQDKEKLYFETGMFYFADRTLLEQGLFQSSACELVETSNYDWIDIDSQADLAITSLLIAGEETR